MLNTQKSHINIEKSHINQIQNFKYLGASLNKIHKIFLVKFAKEVIACLNSFWWDKNISLDTKKKRLGKAIVESVACYGCEVWLLKAEEN